MDYEKLHKDTIAKLQEMVNSGKITVKTACGICADFVPESEDERIRNFLIKQANSVLDSITDDDEEVTAWKSALAWLEKQGNLMKALQISNAKIGELIEKNYYLKEQLEKQGEHTNFLSKIQIGDKVTRNEDGVLVNLSQLNRVAKKQGEQKPVWSEEDEKMFEHIIAKATLHFSSINYLDEEEINFLKSLKDRYTWKPSDEQMDALHYVTNFDYGGHKATLVSLYEQLKKLREE